MFEFIERIVANILNETSPLVIYGYLFLLMFMNSSVMIPPSEYICIVAGIILFNRDVSIIILVLIATSANFLGTAIWYWLGKIHVRKSKTIVRMNYKKDNLWSKIHHLYTRRLIQLEEIYKNHGILLMILLRNIPVIRSIASYPAGRVSMPLNAFTWASMLGIGFWVIIWISLGYILGNIAYNYKWYIALGVGIISLALVKYLLSMLDKKVFMKGKKRIDEVPG